MLRPPWEAHPDIPPGSVGWRMGRGEDYLDRWSEWMRGLSSTQRREYLEGLTPIPAGWSVLVVDWWLYPISAEDDATEEQLESAFAALGVFGGSSSGAE